MNLISRIRFIGQTLADRKNNRNKDRSAIKVAGKTTPSDTAHEPAHMRLGQKLDTTA